MAILELEVSGRPPLISFYVSKDFVRQLVTFDACPGGASRVLMMDNEHNPLGRHGNVDALLFETSLKLYWSFLERLVSSTEFVALDNERGKRGVSRKMRVGQLEPHNPKRFCRRIKRSLAKNDTILLYHPRLDVFWGSICIQMNDICWPKESFLALGIYKVNLNTSDGCCCWIHWIWLFAYLIWFDQLNKSKQRRYLTQITHTFVQQCTGYLKSMANWLLDILGVCQGSGPIALRDSWVMVLWFVGKSDSLSVYVQLETMTNSLLEILEGIVKFSPRWYCMCHWRCSEPTPFRGFLGSWVRFCLFSKWINGLDGLDGLDGLSMDQYPNHDQPFLSTGSVTVSIHLIVEVSVCLLAHGWGICSFPPLWGWYFNVPMEPSAWPQMLESKRNGEEGRGIGWSRNEFRPITCRNEWIASRLQNSNPWPVNSPSLHKELGMFGSLTF